MASSEDKLRPWIVNLELTNACNLACVFCDHAEFIRRGMTCHDMDTRLLESALGDLGDERLHELGLVGLGEPTLDRRLSEHLDVIDRFADRFDRISLNSNLVSLTRPVAEKLLDSRINAYTFSLNASDRETYAQMMGRDCFDKAIANLRTLLSLRRDKTNTPPTVAIQLFDSPRNSEETLRRLIPELDDAQLFTRAVYTKPVIREDTPLLRVRKTEANGRYPCWDMYTRVYIDVDGNVYPCTIGNDCHRANSSLCLGSLRNESLLDIFNGRRIQSARRAAEEGQLPFAECRVCNVWSFTPNNFHWDAAAGRWIQKERVVRAYSLKGQS